MVSVTLRAKCLMGRWTALGGGKTEIGARDTLLMVFLVEQPVKAVKTLRLLVK